MMNAHAWLEDDFVRLRFSSAGDQNVSCTQGRRRSPANPLNPSAWRLMPDSPSTGDQDSNQDRDAEENSKVEGREAGGPGGASQLLRTAAVRCDEATHTPTGPRVAPQLPPPPPPLFLTHSLHHLHSTHAPAFLGQAFPERQLLIIAVDQVNFHPSGYHRHGSDDFSYALKCRGHTRANPSCLRAVGGGPPELKEEIPKRSDW
ncbi:uncharacterized protein LOC127604667 [Hippocampus zosterae]|uniref:uncharacterized protein LOC127604667 n=1 Tax=Hippocampus zosterae TaxID=109293 RepID=UPI00223CC9D6|nr:uncharacterized protein LOC127604667 [Hippocampus zosterae]